MKRFHFSLERVRQWREEQVSAERLRLERLLEERLAIDSRIAALEREKSVSEKSVLAGRLVDAADLHSLDRFRRHTQTLQTQLRTEQGQCDQRIAAQRARIVEAQRNARLLDKVKERKLKAWQSSFDKEIDDQAAESHLARWSRTGRGY